MSVVKQCQSFKWYKIQYANVFEKKKKSSKKSYGKCLNDYYCTVAKLADAYGRNSNVETNVKLNVYNFKLNIRFNVIVVNSLKLSCDVFFERYCDCFRLKIVFYWNQYKFTDGLST